MQKILSWLLVSSLLVSTNFAGLESIPTVSSDSVASIGDFSTSSVLGKASPQMAEKLQVMPGGQVKYKYDEQSLKTLYDQKSSLIEIVCQSEDVFKKLGVNSSIQLNSLGFTKQDLDVNVDIKNCSFYANKTNYNYQNNSWTNDVKAMEIAQKFVDEVFGEKWLVALPKLGKPYIQMRDNGGMMPYSMIRDASFNKESSLSSIEMISGSTATGSEKIETKYNTITIVFPYMVGDTPIYMNYAGQMGATVMVDGNGVVSANAQLLAFKWSPKTADKNNFAGLRKFISQWWTQPFRGNNWSPMTLTLDKPERILVYFNYMWQMGMMTQRNFLSDGIRFGSKVKSDQYSLNNYEMIISDFVIGNNSNALLTDTVEEASLVPTTTISSTTNSISTPKKTYPKKKPFIKKKTPASTGSVAK